MASTAEHQRIDMTKQANIWNTLKLGALAAALTLAAGCHKHPTNTAGTGMAAAPDSTQAAPPATLAADPLAIDLGQSVVLNWRTTNATSVTIEGIGQVP